MTFTATRRPAGRAAQEHGAHAAAAQPPDNALGPDHPRVSCAKFQHYPTPDVNGDISRTNGIRFPSANGRCCCGNPGARTSIQQETGLDAAAFRIPFKPRSEFLSLLSGSALSRRTQCGPEARPGGTSGCQVQTRWITTGLLRPPAVS
jgi:hypothetical protein